MPRSSPVLTTRALNRALLARQMLLSRQRVDAVTAVERLACLQAQWAPAPYVALWSRLDGFRRDDLFSALESGRVIKATLMRSTLHLVTAAEYGRYSRATFQARVSAWKPGTLAPGEALARITDAIVRFAADVPRTRSEIEELVADDLPSNPEERQWLVRTAMAWLVWHPSGAHWQHRREARFVMPPGALTGDVTDDDAYDLLVCRYLAAFGPATLADIASWSGCRTPPLRAALDRIDDLRHHTDDAGRKLVDLPGAPQPGPDVEAPPRFLAPYDAALLGYVARERGRILKEDHRAAVIHRGQVAATFLVDGFVAGTWRVIRRAEAILELQPFTRLTRRDRDALAGEAEKLLAFEAPDARAHAFAFAARDG